MGLDIYLYRYSNYEDTIAREKESQEFDDKLWENSGDYDTLTDEQKDSIRQKIQDHARSLGLSKDGSDEMNKECIEIASEKYPDHYFKIGYFRSSYNEGGIERILRNLGLPTMEDIFDHAGEEYRFRPDWEAALDRVTPLIDGLKSRGAYRVHSVSGNIFQESTIKSEKEALDVFMDKLTKNTDYNYSCSEGEFSIHEPQKVLAMIRGKSKIFAERDCVYVVTESDNTWYVNALEIIKETIEYVLSKKNKEQYYLHWSG